MSTPKPKTRRGTMRAPPPRPVREPIIPVTSDARQTRTVISRTITRAPSAKFIQIERHSDGGVHPDAFQGTHFPATAYAAGGGNGQRSGAAQLAKPLEIGAPHRA